MTGQFLERIPAAALSLDQQLLGDGGQGRIYRVTAIHGRPPTLQLVCKKYKPQWLEVIDAEGLINLVRFQGKLYGAPRELLSERTAWPQAVVEDASGRTIGFLMPAIPENFLRPLHLPGGGKDEYCQLQHLLNDQAYLSLVRIPLKNSWRIEFLRDVAETIDMLHRYGVTVGDLSPLNIFPSFTSIPRCFFVDCDAMKLNGRSVLPQAETRGWQAPAGQPTGTIHSDAYKFALLAIRLFAGDQDTRDPASLSNFSRQLGELARQGIGTNPWSRPSPQQWAHALRLPSGNPLTPIRPASNRSPSQTPTPVRVPSLPQRLSSLNTPTQLWRPPAHTGPTPTGPRPVGSRRGRRRRIGGAVAAATAVLITALVIAAILLTNGFYVAPSLAATIRVGEYPRAAAVSSDGHHVYVTNYNSGSVSVIDTVSESVIATIPVGKSPYWATVTPDNKHVYVTNELSGSVSVIDTQNNSVIKSIPVGRGPLWAVITRDGKRVYVANYDSSLVASSVSVIDTESNSVKASIQVDNNPSWAATSPDGKRIYIANYDSTSVSVIGTVFQSVVSTIPLSDLSDWGVMAPDGKRLYVINSTSGSVSVIDTESNSVIDTIQIGQNRDRSVISAVIAPDGRRLYVTNEESGSVSVIDTEKNSVITIPVGASPTWPVITPDGKRLYVINTTSGSVSVIDTESNSVIDTIPVGEDPGWAVIIPDGKHLYVTNGNSGSMSVIDTGLRTLRSYLPAQS